MELCQLIFALNTLFIYYIIIYYLFINTTVEHARDIYFFPSSQIPVDFDLRFK